MKIHQRIGVIGICLAFISFFSILHSDITGLQVEQWHWYLFLGIFMFGALLFMWD
jgi:Na+-transporting NADH:ubiquinone oxidoreductase subunit NqrB